MALIGEWIFFDQSTKWWLIKETNSNLMKIELFRESNIEWLFSLKLHIFCLSNNVIYWTENTFATFVKHMVINYHSI